METTETYQKDVLDIGKIPIIADLLNVICQTTGMGFAAIARVTEDRWITCSVLDHLNFGLKPSDELQIETTICNEVRQMNRSVVIDHVSEDPEFRNHHTPAMYGFESYISVPIIRKNGDFFGTICALDPKPNTVNTPNILRMFNLFSELISFHLQALEEISASESKLFKERELYRKNEENHKLFTENLEKKVSERTSELQANNQKLEKMNSELQSFAYISSHDLQEPLRKIQTFSSLIEEREAMHLSDGGKTYIKRIKNAAERMQALINDLFAYTQTDNSERKFIHADLSEIIAEVTGDLEEDLQAKNGTIITGQLCSAHIIAFQFRQLLFNLISNSIKFAHPEKPLEIRITCEIKDGDANNALLSSHLKYCHIRIADNGIGFEQKYSDKIFQLLQRLHSRTEFDGTGIGLAIVKKIVENHHGTITANAIPGDGATFDIYLPVIDNVAL